DLPGSSRNASSSVCRSTRIDSGSTSIDAHQDVNVARRSGETSPDTRYEPGASSSAAVSGGNAARRPASSRPGTAENRTVLPDPAAMSRSEEHTSELQSRFDL